MAQNVHALHLYRRILQQHRRALPAQMRSLGDSYVKSEFRLHKKAKAEFVAPFMQQWQHYLDSLPKQKGQMPGKDLEEKELEMLKQDKEKYAQLQQLQRHSTGRPATEDER